MSFRQSAFYLCAPNPHLISLILCYLSEISFLTLYPLQRDPTGKQCQIEAEVILVVARVTVPVATRVPVTSDVEVATPRVDDAVTISEVKVGLADTAIVEVEVRSMLDPAIK